jgi:hypothetical protein
MRTLAQYEVAWNMFRAGSNMEQITSVVVKDRSAIYRWLKKIKQLGIREFIRRKQTRKVRRPRAQTPETTIQKICKELKENYRIAIGLSTIYRWLHKRFTTAAVGIQKYKNTKTWSPPRGPGKWSSMTRSTWAVSRHMSVPTRPLTSLRKSQACSLPATWR